MMKFMRLRKQLLTSAVIVTAFLAGCANPAIEDAHRLARHNQHEAALDRLQKAADENHDDKQLRSELVQQRDVTVAFLIHLAESAKAAGRLDEIKTVLQRLEAAAPDHPRTAWLRSEFARLQRHRRIMEEAQKQLDTKMYERAEAALQTVLAEDPGNSRARGQLARLAELRETQTRQKSTLQLASSNKTITLEFHEASVKTVFEALARATGTNFVFDKDVRGEAKVTLFLHDTTVDEAMRVILSTQQLGSKLLNEKTVLVFPATQQKQHDLLDTVTRTFYLVNADPKQVQSMVRTMAKTRDIYVDDRLNLLMVRDTPEVVRLVERLIQNLDLPDPEVMMELEVMEVSDDDLNSMGITWPSNVSYGVPGSSAPLTSLAGLQAFATNPLAVATLQANVSKSNILANPRIRARNREKAHVLLGEKVPVFTTTSTLGASTTVTPTTSVSITYLDVGLKLDVEPQVQLDNDVTLKVALEVSSITNKVTGPSDSIAYQVGTRQATTTLRLKDGETQILAGLINDTESHSSAGLPFLHELPLVGRLFGQTTHEDKRSEIVLLVTPHIVRNLIQPTTAASPLPSGTDSQPGALPLILNENASAAQEVSIDANSNSLVDRPSPPTMPSTGGGGVLPSISGPEAVAPGASFQITVFNRTRQALNTVLTFDPGTLDAATTDAGKNTGRVPLSIPPNTRQVVSLRVKPDAAEAETSFNVESSGETFSLQIKKASQP